MKITKRQLRRIIREAFAGYADERPNNPMERAYARKEQPRRIVDAETGQIYAEPGMRADFEIWLAENPEYVETPPAIPDERNKTDFYVEPKVVR